MDRTSRRPNILFVFPIAIIFNDDRSIFFELGLRIDDTCELSLALVGLVVVIDHGPELVIVFGDAIVLGEFLAVANDF